MDDGISSDVTIVDLANLCAFFDPTSFGIGYTGLELPSPDGTITAPSGMEQRITELRLKVANLIGWNQYTQERFVSRRSRSLYPLLLQPTTRT